MRMLVPVLGALLAMIGLAAVAVADEAADKKDKEKLQGTWPAVSGEKAGKEDPEAKDHTLIFEEAALARCRSQSRHRDGAGRSRFTHKANYGRARRGCNL